MAEPQPAFEAVAKRLQAALGHTSEQALAEDLGLKQTAWANRKSRGALPLAKINALCESRGISPEWVYKGKGEPRPGVGAAVKPLQDAAKAVAALSLPAHEARLLQELLHYTFAGDRDRALPLIEKLGLATVPRRAARASAGNGSVTDVDDDAVVGYMAFEASWLRAIGLRPGNATVISVDGDSMSPTLVDGDLILVDTSLVERHVSGVYVIVKGRTLHVKRLHFLLDGSIEIRSDNADYKTETMCGAEFDQLHIVGRMVRRLVR